MAGQSTASMSNVQSTLLVAELVFGVILAVAVFGGATVVGLRASAPSELIRRRQAEFTADASHELRTPISVIEAEVGLALDRPREPDYRDVLERVGRESTRLRRIGEDLLWLARADSEQHAPGDYELADVGDVVQNCVVRFGALAAAHGSTSLSSKRQADRTPHGEGAARPHRAIGGGPHRQRVQIRGRSRLASGQCPRHWARVDLRVDDSSPGIPENHRDAVFDRFHRATDNVAGTGLGLAIADAVVRSTQGRVGDWSRRPRWCTSEVSWRKVQTRKGSSRNQARHPTNP